MPIDIDKTPEIVGVRSSYPSHTEMEWVKWQVESKKEPGKMKEVACAVFNKSNVAFFWIDKGDFDKIKEMMKWE